MVTCGRGGKESPKVLFRYIIICCLSLIIPPEDAARTCDEVPPEPAPSAVVPSRAAVQVPNHERRDLTEEAQQFIRSIALLLIPQKFEDDNGWGDEKRIQSGLYVDFENGRLKTKRRWNHVNHGSWLRGSGELVDPDKTFSLKATQLPDPDADTQRYEVEVSSRLLIRGRQQQWNYGVMLWSISAEAIADLGLRATFDVKTEVVTTDKGARLRFQPQIVRAAADLKRFTLLSVSRAKGPAVRGTGELVEELIEMRIKQENRSLAARINKALLKKPDLIEIPFDIGGWFGWNSKPAETGKAPAAVPDVPEP